MTDSNTPLVSILILSYNQEQFIKAALESALNQEYPNIEVVVADDASSDRTHAILETYKQRFHDKLKISINAVNMGITANSNIGLRHCAGKWIAFMGGDDALRPGKIKQQVEWFQKNPEGVLCGHDVEWINAEGDSLGFTTSELVPIQKGRGAAKFIMNGTPFSAVSIMVRRDRIPCYGFHPCLPVVSDWKLWIDVIGTNGVYGYIPGIWAYYRRHSNNITVKLNGPVVRDVVLTALLSIWHFHGRYFQYWSYYFFIRPFVKRAWRKSIE